MKTPTSQDIAGRAYSIWENRGHPQDYESSVDCWLTAERELTEADSESAQSSEGADEPGLDLKSGPEVTNLDRSLSAAERSRVRDERREKKSAQGKNGDNGDVRTTASSGAIEHFIVTADRAKLRIYQDGAVSDHADQSLRVASSFDLPDGKRGYTDRDTDQAGRFPGPRGKGAALGGSTDERLPMLEEQQRRAASELGSRVNAFFHEHPRATWDFAAGPVIHRALLDVLDEDVRERLGEALVKELSNQPLPELRQHFSHAEVDES